MDDFEFPLLLILAMTFMYTLIMAVIWVASRHGSGGAGSTRLPAACRTHRQHGARRIT